MTTQIKRRRGTSAEHATFTGAEGELTVNTTNESVHVHDGSTAGGFELARADGSNLAMGSDLTFGDNDKAIFGAGSDLQIYHDGFNSWLTDQGQGDMYITTLGNAIYFSKHGTENLMSLNVDGDVKLYYDNSLKLSTTSTGIDVTGTVTADGLTVDGNPVLNNVAPRLFFQTGATHYNWQIAAQENVDAGFEIGSGSQDAGATNDTYTKHLVIEQSGDISFYEDTGTTAKFFWDASAESLGIGSSDAAPSGATTDLYIDSSVPMIELQDSDDSTYSRVYHSAGSFLIDVDRGNTGASSYFQVKVDDNSSKVLKLDSSGNVGIGTSSPARTFHIHDVQPYLHMTNPVTGSTSNDGFSILVEQTNGQVFINQRENQPIVTYVNGTERMRIDSSGNLLVGTTSTNPTTGTSEGIALSSGGLVMASNSSDAALALNRTATNGDISIFKKDGSPVGSIGSEGGDALYIQSGTTSGAGLHFHPTAGNINPARNGAKVDNALDLGRSTHRFKNLYLSGGVYLGGTGSANHLDDYETGTISSISAKDGTSGTTLGGSFSGTYVKIGDMVFCDIFLSNLDKTGTTTSNTLYFTGLPFAATQTAYGSVQLDKITFSGFVQAQVVSGSAYGVFRHNVSNTADTPLLVSAIYTNNQSDIYFSIAYSVA